MKKIFNTYKFLGLVALFLVVASCDKDFLDIPSEDGITLGDYYSSNAQVAAATNVLYNRTWFLFQERAFFAIGEIGSGNMYSGSSDVSALRNFSMTSTDGQLLNGWKALFAVVAQSNTLINFLEERADASVDPKVLQNTIGEAYFMRATAYFYLVRLWGAVPIIENNLDYIDNPRINTNNVEDVYELITRDYTEAMNRLVFKTRGSNYDANGHVSKGSAEAMLAKVYLYLKDYPMAKTHAGNVINSGEFALLGGDVLPSKSFGDLFLLENNNNEESIFALQWKVNADYGNANNCNTRFSYENSLSNTTYSATFGPSQDILNAYTASDLRRKETFMLPGDEYPNLLKEDGTTLVFPTEEIDGAQGSGSGIKKYVLGKAGGPAGPADEWGMMENNTYIMRYAELLLIYAEACLSGGTSTTDTSALEAYNNVRNRAGLNDDADNTLTFDEIFTERRLELAFEGEYWYDLGRIPRADAIAIMSAQNRGNKDTPEYFTPSESDFKMPYPDADVVANPLLLEPSVPYNFN